MTSSPASAWASTRPERDAPLLAEGLARRPFFRTAFMLAALVGLILVLPGAARAAGDPFADIAATNFDLVAQGVQELAVSGSPRAAAVIAALRDRRLFAWKWPRPDTPLYIRTDKGFVDARTGAAGGSAGAGEPAAGHRQRFGALGDRDRRRRARSVLEESRSAAQGGRGDFPIGRCRCAAADRAGAG